MKICVFSYDFYPIVGGAGVYVNELYHKRISKIHDVNIIYPKNKIYRSPVGFILFSFINSFLINLIQSKENYDVVNWQVGPNGFFLLRKPKNCLCIATSHHTYYQQSHKIKSQFWKRIFIPLEIITYRLADKILADSEGTRDTLIKYYGVNKNKIKLIPIGVNIDHFKKLKVKKIHNSLLFVGRLDKRKGIDFLIETMPLVVKEIPDIKLFVIGKGKMREKLEKFVEQNNLKDNVEFLGFVSDEDLPVWYNKCKLTIVPSIFEGFGITVIESLACGTPVIGTDTDGIRDIIKDKRWLVKYGDVRDLSKKIKELTKSKRTYILDKGKFSMDNVLIKIEETFR